MLNVCLLGQFQIEKDGLLVTDETLRSDMLKKLLGYVLTHRDHPITAQELSEALWQEDETENPMGALKNLMYRLRTILKKTLGDANYIITSPGAYAWNPELPVTLDVEVFEHYCNLIKNGSGEEDLADNCEKALACYRGEFLENIVDRHWVVAMSTYYHSLFLAATKTLAAYYMEREQYEELERICINGLRHDGVDEQLHYYRIMSLIRRNNYDLAMKNYEAARKVLYDALGVRDSGVLREAHQELLKMSKGVASERLENIQEDMVEKERPKGAFLCGYPVFREIYRLEVRKHDRQGDAEFMVLYTLSLDEGIHADNERVEKFMITKAMAQFEEALKQTLRVADIAARYSDNQYIILLPACTYENSLQVTKRIMKQFNSMNRGRKVEVKAEYEQVSIEGSSFVK